jgi:hypothetical protein
MENKILKDIKSPSIKDALKGEYKPKQSYSDKLKNQLWQRKRLEILQLRGFKCELCNCETKELHVHHRFYLKGREVWQYDNDVFQVLCCDCHKKEHSKSVDKEYNLPKNYKEIIQLTDGEGLNNSDHLLEILQTFTMYDLTTVLVDLRIIFTCGNETEYLISVIKYLAQSVKSNSELWDRIGILNNEISKLKL